MRILERERYPNFPFVLDANWDEKFREMAYIPSPWPSSPVLIVEPEQCRSLSVLSVATLHLNRIIADTDRSVLMRAYVI